MTPEIAGVPYDQAATVAAGRAGLEPSEPLPERELTAAVARLAGCSRSEAKAALRSAADAGELAEREPPDGFDGSDVAYTTPLVAVTDSEWRARVEPASEQNQPADSEGGRSVDSPPVEADTSGSEPADTQEPADQPADQPTGTTETGADQPTGTTDQPADQPADQPTGTTDQPAEPTAGNTDDPAVRASRADTRLVEAGPDGPGVYVGPSASGDVETAAVDTDGWLAPPSSGDGFRWAFLSRLESDPAFASAVRSLRGGTIACDCSKPAECHGRVVLEYLDKHTEPADSSKSDPEEPPTEGVGGGGNGRQTGMDSPESDAIPWRDALAAAIGWYHDQLDAEIADHTDAGSHPDRPTTAREYFTDRRGWDADTIADKQLGYAPADSDGLLTYLRSEGYGDAAIRATGLFTEDLRPLWHGRYVFPYFDADGQPVYAIARVTGGDGGGAKGYGGHPDDFLSGKYAKLAHSKPYVHASEPIYGAPSLEQGEPVIITEGMADAISAHAAGVPCLSPVTTKFKQEHYEPLRELLAAYDVPRVYIIQDNDPPKSDVAGDTDGWDALETPQVPPGLKGALGTAAYLDGEGFAVRVAVPPAPATAKVDLDDYLTDGWGSIGALLAAAKPAESHPAYETATAPDRGDHADAVADALGGGDTATETAGGETSALFELDFSEVTGLQAGYRGENPVAPAGGSRSDYFVVTEADGGDVCGYDHKRKAAYNALSTLLVKAGGTGGRRPDNTSGELSDREIWTAWKQAHADGLLPDGDPVPYRALLHIIRHHDLYPGEYLPDTYNPDDGDRLPSSAYNRALETIREEYGLSPGREPVGGTTPSRSELGLNKEPESREEQIDQFLKDLGYRARETGE